MKVTRTQILAISSALYLLALTLLAGYALHASRAYSLPIPTALSVLTFLLPLLSGILPPTAITLLNLVVRRINARSNGRSNSLQRFLRSTSPMSLIRMINTALLLLTTIFATLSGTHASTFIGQLCTLQSRWQALYRAKDADAIAHLQGLLQCCGFRSSRDMAWPFPDKGHGADACEVRFERRVGCAEGWGEKERMLAWLMVLVAVGVGMWLVFVGGGGMNMGMGQDEGRLRLVDSVEEVDDEEADDADDADVEGGMARRIAYRDGGIAGVEHRGSGRIEESVDGTAETSSLIDGGKKWREPTEE